MATATPAADYVDIGTLIDFDPALYHGWPCLTGTRFPVHMFASYVNWGWTVEQILEDGPDVDRVLILAGLAHCLANKERIDREIADETARNLAMLEASQELYTPIDIS